jgi:hypothetical protein
MPDNAALERRLSELERRHDMTRKLLVDVISLVVAFSALFYFQPGIVGSLFVGFGAAVVVPCVLDLRFVSDELPRESKPNIKSDPALARWLVIAGIAGVLVLAAAVAAFVMLGIGTIHSAG